MRHLVSLRLNKEFKHAYYQGKYKASPALVTYLVKNRGKQGRGTVRVGITTGKKVGKAYQRNRARRVIRAAWISVRGEFDRLKGYDLVFLARAPILEMKSTEVARLMKKQLSRLLSAQENGRKRPT